MRLGDLSPEVLDRIRKMRYDWFVNKHEGPFDWDFHLRAGDVEIFPVGGFNVLLPVEKDYHPNITVLRSIVGDGGQSLTLFLKDTTFAKDPLAQAFTAGFVAVCDKLEGEDVFIAILYHEWFIVQND